MPPLPPSNTHRPHGYAAEAREWLVERARALGGPTPPETLADLFLAEAWAAGLKLVPLEEHDLDIGKVA